MERPLNAEHTGWTMQAKSKTMDRTRMMTAYSTNLDFSQLVQWKTLLRHGSCWCSEIALVWIPLTFKGVLAMVFRDYFYSNQDGSVGSLETENPATRFSRCWKVDVNITSHVASIPWPWRMFLKCLPWAFTKVSDGADSVSLTQELDFSSVDLPHWRPQTQIQVTRDSSGMLLCVDVQVPAAGGRVSSKMAFLWSMWI
ncbi:unnamed protein product [Boreogadus saida]